MHIAAKNRLGKKEFFFRHIKNVRKAPDAAGGDQNINASIFFVGKSYQLLNVFFAADICLKKFGFIAGFF